jgi:hypothetical protein
MKRGKVPIARPRLSTVRLGLGRAVTLVEVVIATAITSVAMMALIMLVVMCMKFMQEGFWENQLRSEGAFFLERTRMLLTFAYRPDAIDLNLVPVVSDTKDSIIFFTPDSDGDDFPEGYALFRQGSQLMLARNGVEEEILGRVFDFHVDMQEGMVSMMVTIRASFSLGSRQADKRFTLVARALPRNMGEMAWDGTTP